MPAKKKFTLPELNTGILGFDKALVSDLSDIISSTRQTVPRRVNAVMVMLYWKVGNRIRRNALKVKGPKYAWDIMPTLSAKLVPEFVQQLLCR